MEDHFFLAPLDEDTVFIFLLAKKLGIKHDVLHFLYEEYGSDLFFIFYMLSSCKVSFLTGLQFNRLREKSKSLHSKLVKGIEDKALETDPDKDLNQLEKQFYSILDIKTKEIKVKMSDVVYKES